MPLSPLKPTDLMVQRPFSFIEQLQRWLLNSWGGGQARFRVCCLRSKRLRFFILSSLLSLLTGLLMAGGFPPFDLQSHHLGEWLSWGSFAPITIALLMIPLPRLWWKRLLLGGLLGYLSGILFFAMTLSWIATVAWEGVVALPLYLGLYQAVWAAFFLMVLRPFLLAEQKKDNEEKVTSDWSDSLGWLVEKSWPCWRGVVTLLLAAAAWSGLEWLRGIAFTGFTWNSFGVAFHRAIPLIQLADITGIYGISFLGVMVGVGLGLALLRLGSLYSKISRQGKRRKLMGKEVLKEVARGVVRLFCEMGVILLLLVAAFCYGKYRLMTSEAGEAPMVQLKVAAIQGNIPMDQYWDATFEQHIRNVYQQETLKILDQHPELIIWPEESTLRPFLQDPASFGVVEGLMSQAGSDFLLGSVQCEDHPARDYNAAILLTQGGSTYDYYAKTHLLAFGEYIPLRKAFPPFRWIIGDRLGGDFTPGPGPHPMRLSKKPIKIGTLICFEDTFGPLVGDFVRQGAQGMIVLINDGWFGHSAASRQHELNALFRAVETKVPLLRVANTGVSVAIDPFGKIVKTMQDQHGNSFLAGALTLNWELPQHPPTTFYTKHGDLFAQVTLALAGGATLLAIGFSLFRKKTGKKQRKN